MPRYSVLAVAAVAALSGAGGALAQAKKVNADEQVAAGERALAAGDLAAAAAAVTRGLEASPRHLGLLFLRGKIELRRRRYDAAVKAYRAFLAAKPRGANKRKAELILENLAAVGSTFLELTVENGPAQIYLDSKSPGVYCVADPVCKVGMMPGRYRLIIEREGAVPVTRDVEILYGQTTAIRESFQLRSTPLSIRVSPGDATVTLDGVTLGTGDRVVEVAPGKHELSVFRDGFVRQSRRVAVAAGERAAASFDLDRLVPLVGIPGNVEVEASLDGKPVAVDGGAVAVPDDGRPHHLVVRAPGRDEVALDVPADHTGPLEVRLGGGAFTAAGPTRDQGEGGGWSRGRKIAFASLATAGAVGVGLGALFGVQAIGKRDDAEAQCDDMDVCSAAGLDLLDEARSRANLSNLSFGVGVAALVGGAVVWLTAPSAGQGGPAIDASIGRGGMNFSVKVGF